MLKPIFLLLISFCISCVQYSNNESIEFVSWEEENSEETFELGYDVRDRPYQLMNLYFDTNIDLTDRTVIVSINGHEQRESIIFGRVVGPWRPELMPDGRHRLTITFLEDFWRSNEAYTSMVGSLLLNGQVLRIQLQICNSERTICSRTEVLEHRVILSSDCRSETTDFHVYRYYCNDRLVLTR